MKVKLVPGTFGLGLTYDSFNSPIYLTLLFWTIKFHRPRVGNCLHCSHPSARHRADRSSGIIVWRCNGLHNGVACACDHYAPEQA